MSDPNLYDLLQKIHDVTVVDMRHKTIFELFTNTASELGEIADEMVIEQKSLGCEDKEPDEGVKGESVDLFICAMALYFASGGTIEHFVEYSYKKLNKWVEKQTKAIARRTP